MSLTFQPKSEEEIKKFGLLVDGEYDFEVLSADHAVSKKSGNSMIKLNLLVYGDDGLTSRVFDYLIASFESKLRHFCDSTGLLPQYQQGTLQAYDCKGRTGKCRLVIKKQDGYEDKNEVKDYVLRKAKPIEQAAPMKSTEPEDDVPF